MEELFLCVKSNIFDLEKEKKEYYPPLRIFCVLLRNIIPACFLSGFLSDSNSLLSKY